jgi:hypothetical protein
MIPIKGQAPSTKLNMLIVLSADEVANMEIRGGGGDGTDGPSDRRSLAAELSVRRWGCC